MEEFQKYYTYKKMQEMLPDYVFNRLDQSEKEKFESSLELFPDLIKEIDDAKRVFSKIEKMDFNSIIEKKARNISVKVQDRIRYKKHKERIPAYFFKIVVPTLGMAAIVLYLFITGLHNLNNEQSKINNNSINHSYRILTDNDINLIFDDIDTNNTDISYVFEHYAHSFNNSELSDNYFAKRMKIDDYYSDALNDFIFSDNFHSIPNILNYIYNENWNINDLIENLDKDDINKILEDIKNEDIFS